MARVLISLRAAGHVPSAQADIHHLCTPVSVHSGFKAIFATIMCFLILLFSFLSLRSKGKSKGSPTSRPPWSNTEAALGTTQRSKAPALKRPALSVTAQDCCWLHGPAIARAVTCTLSACLRQVTWKPGINHQTQQAQFNVLGSPLTLPQTCCAWPVRSHLLAVTALKQ